MDPAKRELLAKDFSSAVQHAWKQAEKRGYEVDKDDWDRKIAMGPRKPGEGKTNTYSIGLTKAGKPAFSSAVTLDPASKEYKALMKEFEAAKKTPGGAAAWIKANPKKAIVTTTR